MRPRLLAMTVLPLLLFAGERAVFAGKPEARALFGRGNAEFAAKRYAQAIELFERAYVEHPAPAFLFNIAQAHRHLGHCAEALEFYRRYLEQKPKASVRREVERHIAKLREQCAEPPPDAERTPPAQPPQ